MNLLKGAGNRRNYLAARMPTFAKQRRGTIAHIIVSSRVRPKTRAVSAIAYDSFKWNL